MKNALVIFFSCLVALSGWAQVHVGHGDLLEWREIIEPAHLLSLLGPIGGVFLAFFLKEQRK